MTLDSLREFLGWCTILSCGILLFSSAALLALREPITRLHGKLFHLDAAAVRQEYFRYLANFKIAVLVLNLVPYLALRIMG